MACNNKFITIYQGFGTKWDNNDLLNVSFDSDVDIDGFGAEFSIGCITKTYTDIQNGFSINLTAQETSTLPIGPNSGTLVIIDLENNKKPFSTELPFMVKDWAEGDIKLDDFNLSIDAKVQENTLTINIQSPNVSAEIEKYVQEQIAEHNSDSLAHPYIQNLIDEKLDKVSTPNQVYGTDASGEQTTYDIDSFGKQDIQGDDLIGVSIDGNVVQLSSKTFIFEQGIASAEWDIVHNLGKRPSIQLVDSSGRVFEADKEYVNNNEVLIKLNAATTGFAYLN